MKQFTYTIKDELGIHARPAGLLAKKAKSYADTAVTLTANGKTVNLAGDTAYDLDWSKMNNMDGADVNGIEDHAEDVSNALVEWEGNLCTFPATE
jgi:hypothetical protein